MKETPTKKNFEQTLHEIAKFQFILSEGKKGHHVLFDPQLIRMTFAKNTEELRKLFHERIDDINRALNETFNHKSFEQKKDFIRTLPEELQHALVFGYFQLIEGQDQEEERTVN